MLTIEELKVAKEALKLVHTQMKIKHLTVDATSVDIFVQKAMKDKEREFSKVIEAIETELERLLFEEEFIEKETRANHETSTSGFRIEANGHEHGRYQIFIVNMFPSPATESLDFGEEINAILDNLKSEARVGWVSAPTDLHRSRRLHFYSNEIDIDTVLRAVNLFAERYRVPAADFKIDCLTIV